MQLSRFIAARLALGKFKSFASLIIRLAWFGVGLSVAVMIVSMAVVIGYKKKITDKVLGFGSDIEIHSVGTRGSYDYVQFNDSPALVASIRKMPNILKVMPVMSRPGIIKASEELEGIVFKGVDSSYDFAFLKRNMVRGTLPRVSDSLHKREILISSTIAKRIHLDTGDQVKMYFINEPIRVIPCTICGIYETGLEENDMVYVIGSLKEMQRIFAKRKPEITHYEVTTADLEQLQATSDALNKSLPQELNAESLVELNRNIFDWLGYLDQNIVIILTLMVIVSCINMITALLILIIERTNMVGVMKALGSRNDLIKRIFLNHAAYILVLGLLFGNILGLGVCILQDHFKLITLRQEIYYLPYVPIYLNPLHVLAINIGTVLICMTALLLPVRLINKIEPVKAIKFN